MKILIFGDICPTDDTQSLFNSGNVGILFNDIHDEMMESDIVIGNLECAVADIPTPIKKTGPILHTNTKSLSVLKDFTALSLANNHIRDCGDEGVLSAIQTCNHLGIKTFGAGKNLKEAKAPLIVDQAGKRIGFMSFAEQEFNTATETQPGAGYLDLYDDFEHIRNFRKNVDYLIILYHGGIEYFQYPTPELRRKCHKFIDCGADFVTCQHSHCIGTIEQYSGKTIVYGQGNGVFGYKKGDDRWNSGLLLKIELSENGSDVISRFSYQGITASPNGIHLMGSEGQKELEQEITDRSRKSEDEKKKEWNKFCDDYALIHLPLLLGWSRFLIAINKRSKGAVIRLLYGKWRKTVTLNILRCESHREVIMNVLKKDGFI